MGSNFRTITNTNSFSLDYINLLADTITRLCTRLIRDISQMLTANSQNSFNLRQS